MSDRYFDAVILGGGVIGLSTAYSLSQKGASVAVLDTGEMGHGSSLRNAGYISPSHFIPLAAPGVFTQGLKWMFNPQSPLYIPFRLDPDFIAWTLRFAQACNAQRVSRAAPVLLDLLQKSKLLLVEMAQTQKMAIQLEGQGLTLLFHSEKGRKHCEHEAEVARQLSVEAKFLNLAELNALDPQIDFKALGGLHFSADMHLRPEALVQSLVQWLREKNVSLFSKVSGIEFETLGSSKEKWISHVKTHHGIFKSKEFILCSGAWSSQLGRELGLRISLQAGKGYSITVAHPPIIPSHPYLGVERRLAITPFADGLRFAGTMEFSGTTSHINHSRVEAILDSISYYFNNIPRPDAQSHLVWAGLRPVTPDGLPYLGRHRPYRNLITATGHAMLGVSLSAVTGKIVSDLVFNQSPSHDLTLLDPNRYDS